MHLWLVALVLTSCNSCCSWYWNNLSKSLRLTGVTWWISRSNCSIAFWQSAYDQVIATCRGPFRRTSNCLRFVVETFPIPSTRTSIAAQILWRICLHNWWNSVANGSSTVTFTDFNIFWSQNILFFWQNPLSASSSALRDRSERFCSPTSRENSHDACTAPVTIASEAALAAVSPSSLEQTRIGMQFTECALIIQQVSLPCHAMLFNESNGLGKCWRPGYHGTDVNWLSNSLLTFLSLRYLSSQCNQSLTKPRSGWCNWSDCRSQ